MMTGGSVATAIRPVRGGASPSEPDAAALSVERSLRASRNEAAKATNASPASPATPTANGQPHRVASRGMTGGTTSHPA